MMRNLYNRPTFEVDAVDVPDCKAQAVHRIGSPDNSHFACHVHREEVVSACWDDEPNLPIFDIEPTPAHICGDTPTTRREASRNSAQRAELHRRKMQDPGYAAEHRAKDAARARKKYWEQRKSGGGQS